MSEHDLAVSEVFGPTLQGEGPSAGCRSGFVRLARCNLDCVWCDTAYTWDWSRFDPAAEVRRLSAEEVIDRLDQIDAELVVITGGEPLLQQAGLTPVLAACRERGRRLEVETNGTIAPAESLIALVDCFNVSPKLSNSGVPLGRRIKADVLGTLMASGRSIFKFVVSGIDDLDEVAQIVEELDLYPVWIMPEGGGSDGLLRRMKALADPVIARGWNLSPRLQVLLWEAERGR